MKNSKYLLNLIRINRICIIFCQRTLNLFILGFFKVELVYLALFIKLSLSLIS